MPLAQRPTPCKFVNCKYVSPLELNVEKPGKPSRTAPCQVNVEKPGKPSLQEFLKPKVLQTTNSYFRSSIERYLEDVCSPADWEESVDAFWRELESAPESFRRDRRFLLTAAQLLGAYVLPYVPQEMWADRDFALVMVRRSSSFLPHLSEELLADRELMLAACQAHADALLYAAPTLKVNRSFLIEVMQECGWALSHTSEEARQDYAIVAAAVQQNKWAVQFAAEALQQDPRIKMLLP